jgi:protein gp37
MPTSIPWVLSPDGTAGATWNPITGCRRASPGCEHCYAERLASTRLRHLPAYAGLTRDGRWTGEQRFSAAALDVPLRRRKPTGYFCCDMSDLFGEGVTDEQIAAVFGVMAATPRHRYYVLTKRAARMQQWFSWISRRMVSPALACIGTAQTEMTRPLVGSVPAWPLPNVYLGATVEDQQRADERIPDLLACPAAVRFLSVEPMLGPVDLSDLIIHDNQPGEQHFDALHCDVDPGDDGDTNGATLDWVIVGGESGPRARPMHPDWPRAVRDQCGAARVPFFFKQWGEHVYLDQAPDETVREIDAAVNLAGNPDIDRPWRVGVKAAGHLLDGREWREMPGGSDA